MNSIGYWFYNTSTLTIMKLYASSLMSEFTVSRNLLPLLQRSPIFSKLIQYLLSCLHVIGRWTPNLDKLAENSLDLCNSHSTMDSQD